jgi:hypothetical protein
MALRNPKQRGQAQQDCHTWGNEDIPRRQFAPSVPVKSLAATGTGRKETKDGNVLRQFQ